MEFVNFSIAKKLKEKGFRKECLAFYGEHGDFCYNGYIEDGYVDLINLRECNNYGNAYDAPTISQVLKWLRDNCTTHLEISVGRFGWYFATTNYEYHEEEKVYDFTTTHVSDSWDSYEEAALAGIEYTLDNLI